MRCGTSSASTGFFIQDAFDCCDQRWDVLIGRCRPRSPQRSDRRRGLECCGHRSSLARGPRGEKLRVENDLHVSADSIVNHGDARPRRLNTRCIFQNSSAAFLDVNEKEVWVLRRHEVRFESLLPVRDCGCRGEWSGFLQRRRRFRATSAHRLRTLQGRRRCGPIPDRPADRRRCRGGFHPWRPIQRHEYCGTRATRRV